MAAFSAHTALRYNKVVFHHWKANNSKLYYNRMNYRHHLQIKYEVINGRHSLTTKHNGRVIIDSMMHSLWEIANGRSLEEIIHQFQAVGSVPLTTAAGIGCLVEAGLLERESTGERTPPGRIPQTFDPQIAPFISAVIVSYNGIEWLGPCLDSLLAQTYPNIELLIVDNGSTDGTAQWIRDHYPTARIIENQEPVSLAMAINLGCAAAKGGSYLILNQDVYLDPSCVAEMAIALRDPLMAACAPNIHFMWAPSFINGIGNHYRVSNWGADNAIGHLDLNQFAAWDEVPSVCFAAALIASQAWKEIGPLDENFTMYYEDSDWSYRARLQGYHLGAVPSAYVYHAMSGHHGYLPTSLSASKLNHVVYGRLRFTARLLSTSRKIFALISFALQDIIEVILSLITLKFSRACSVLRGWGKFILNPPQKIAGNAQLHNEIFKRDHKIPQPHIWKELPELTWDVVCCEYMPLMLNKKTRFIPEINAVIGQSNAYSAPGYFSCLRHAWLGGSGTAFLRKIWRDFRWLLG